MRTPFRPVALMRRQRMTDMANKNISLNSGAEVNDFLLEMLREALSKLMELEVESLTGAGLGERTEERRNSRNGYRDRSYDSRLGELALRIPKLRQGTYFPSFLEPRRMVEKALV